MYNEIFINNINTIKKIYKKNEDFFNDLGISRSTMASWKSGRRNPRLDTIVIICAKLNINLTDMVTKKLNVKFCFEFEDLKGEDNE